MSTQQRQPGASSALSQPGIRVVARYAPPLPVTAQLPSISSEQTGDFSLDAVVKGTPTASFAVNAVIKVRWSTATYSQDVLASSPVSYWRLGEPSGTTAADERSANPGSYVGTPTLAQTGALYNDANTAVLLNGTSQYVSVPYAASLAPSGLMVEAWVKFTSLTANAWVTLFARERWDANDGWFLNYQNGPLGGGDGSLTLYVLGAASSSRQWNPGTGIWHHVAFTRSDPAWKLWIDGRTVATGIKTYTENTQGLYIGARHTNPGTGSTDYFPGTIDEVALYDSALTDAIADHILSRAGRLLTPFTLNALFEINRTGTPFTLDAVIKKTRYGPPETVFSWTFVCGGECNDLLGPHSDLVYYSHWFYRSSANPPSIESTTVRSGSHAIRFADAEGALAYLYANSPDATNGWVVRTYVYAETLPASENFSLLQTSKAGGNWGLLYNGSTGKFAWGELGNPSVDTSVTFEAGRWYRIDMQFDMSANPWGVDLQIDGVAQTQQTPAYAANNTQVFVVGPFYGPTPEEYALIVDDFLLIAPGGGYPVGDGAVHGSNWADEEATKPNLDAVVQKTQTSSGTVSAHVLAHPSATITLSAKIVAPPLVWTTPADTVGITATPQLTFLMPTVVSRPMHFHMQIDTVATFDSGNLREAKTNADQTGWEYWNGSAWTPVPAGGVPAIYAGNEARYTPATLTAGTWYRRVRLGLA